jgi:sortase A
MRWTIRLERLLLIVGILLLGLFLGAHVHRAVLSRVALQSFKPDRNRAVEVSGGIQLATVPPDFTLWAPKRIQGYEDSLNAQFAPAIGILRISRINLEVPVLNDTDDLSLNRGVGRIAGSAKIGENGNMGIAGHRDGFFRGLKDVAIGDRIELVTAKGTETYAIDNIVIVDPSDVSVLAPRSRPSLTLVTCYPFYFVGSAPKRYIVEATATDALPNPSSGEQSTVEAKNTQGQKNTRASGTPRPTVPDPNHD